VPGLIVGFAAGFVSSGLRPGRLLVGCALSPRQHTGRSLCWDRSCADGRTVLATSGDSLLSQSQAIGQSASILFSTHNRNGNAAGRVLVLGAINEMRLLVRAMPGDRMEMEIQVLKFIEDFALVEAVATVDGTVVARGRLGFARRGLQTPPA